jgi:hypothetical protein
MDERVERSVDPERYAEMLAEESEEHAEMTSRLMALRAEVARLTATEAALRTRLAEVWAERDALLADRARMAEAVSRMIAEDEIT